MPYTTKLALYNIYTNKNYISELCNAFPLKKKTLVKFPLHWSPCSFPEHIPLDYVIKPFLSSQELP